MAVLLREVTCRCGVVFYLCSACDRGHRYCSDACRQAARRSSLHRARLKYARSERGRKKNRDRARRFRRRHGSRPPRRARRRPARSEQDHRDRARRFQQRHGEWRKISKKRNGSPFSSQAECALMRAWHPCSRPLQPLVAGVSPDPSGLRLSWKPPQRSVCARPAPMRRRGDPREALAVHSAARCHLCGRPGRIVRSRHRRGRFRESASEPPEG